MILFGKAKILSTLFYWEFPSTSTAFHFFFVQSSVCLLFLLQNAIRREIFQITPQIGQKLFAPGFHDYEGFILEFHIYVKHGEDRIVFAYKH